MDIARKNPDTLFNSKDFGFTQVVASKGGTIVHCSGQTAWNSKMELIGKDDFAAQTREALRNVGYALRAVGAQPSHVTRIHLYVVDHKPDYLAIIGKAVTEFFGPDHLPASTLIGVHRLALPEFLIEIEATAVIPG
jgi:enamine deaminase RidA (YjgF/YER057c/UK114 family)